MKTPTPIKRKLANESKVVRKGAKALFYKLSKDPQKLFGVIVPRVIEWLTANFQLKLMVNQYQYKLLSSSILETFKSRGNEEGVKWVKNLRLAVMKFLEGNPMSASLDLYHDGVPRVLGPEIAKALREGWSDDIRIVLTILNATRALALGDKPDVESITKPLNKGENYSLLIKDFELYSKSFWVANGFRWNTKDNWVPRKLRRLDYHFTTKRGPNGHALWTSLKDLIAIKNTCVFDAIKTLGGPKVAIKLDTLVRFLPLIQSIIPEWFVSISESKLKKVKDQFGAMINPPVSLLEKEEVLSNRRISYFPDKEFKVRVVAIGDYFSQAMLRPLHSWLYKFLENIPQDHTHNQGGFKTLLNNTNKEKFCSADLTAATDRFPIEVICTVLRGRLPAAWVAAWETVMIGLPFDYNGTAIRYAVGNPMGFYSSWASFSVSHHFIIYYICMKLGKDWRTASYALLGDDIVIKDDAIAKYYKEIMNTLGVEVSVLKTHESDHFFEFAKRLFYKNVEVSPFPISALQEVSSKYYLLTALLIEVEKKGWVPVKSIPVTVSSFASSVLHRKARNCASWEKEAWGVEHIIKVMRGVVSGGAFMTEYSARLKIPQIKPFSDEESDAILSNIAVELFSSSNPANSEFKEKSSIPLGELATSWVMRLTELMNHEDPDVANAIIDLIPTIPQVRGYGTVEETYMSLIREATLIDRTGRNWPKIMRTMALPLDDKIFVLRTSHMISKGAALLSKHLTPRMVMISQYPMLRQ